MIGDKRLPGRRVYRSAWSLPIGCIEYSPIDFEILLEIRQSVVDTI